MRSGNSLSADKELINDWDICDLTMPLGSATTPVPNHPRVELTPLHTHERDGLSNTILRCSVHTGTHVDAPFHFVPDGLTMDQVPLERLIGPAWHCDLLGHPRAPITVGELISGGLPQDGVLSGCIAVLNSGWADDHWNSEQLYTGNPYLDPQAATWLRDQGLLAVAVDFAVDREPPYPVHRVLLGAGIPIIENLIGLSRLPRSGFLIFALPAKIVGGNGGGARVVALCPKDRS